MDREKKQISDALTSVKYISKTIAQHLYDMRDLHFDTFTDLLLHLSNDRVFNTRSIEILIRMGYFEEFGTTGKLLDVFNEFFNGEGRYSKTLVERSRMKRLEGLRRFEEACLPRELPPQEQVVFEGQYYGTPISTFDVKNLYYAMDVNTAYSPKIKLYSLRTGGVGTVKIRKPYFEETPFKPGDVIEVYSHRKAPAYAYVDGKRIKRPDITELWIDSYSVLPSMQ